MHFNPQDLSPEEAYGYFISAMVPRPIALVSTVSNAGLPNAAPYSFANGVCGRPPMVAFSAGQRRDYATGELSLKDTPRNIDEIGDFVVNIVDDALAEAMNAASADFPPEVSEFEECDITLKQIDTLRLNLMKTLASVYHSRMEYPDLEDVKAHKEAKKNGNGGNNEQNKS